MVMRDGKHHRHRRENSPDNKGDCDTLALLLSNAKVMRENSPDNKGDCDPAWGLCGRLQAAIEGK